MSDTTRKPGDSLPEVKKSTVSQATGSEASVMLTPGVSYAGQVISRQGDGTYKVDVDDPKTTVSGVRIATPVLGGLLGLQIRANLPELTQVKLVYGSPSFIYCTLPENNTDWLNARTRSLLWGPDMDGEQGVDSNIFSSHAEDLLEGEVEFANLYGVAMEFLTTIMRMRAGDRAAVECHLINDMVRVISSQFRHVSGLGEDLIFDHGRPTQERTWSMYRHEVLGALEEKEPFATMNGDEVDREEMEASRVLEVGRHRFREFVGFAGDFIHSFISDPPAAMASLAQGSAGAGGGKSWIHRNSDGSILMQSVADIRFERVCRIPVAVRYAHHEDPEVTKAREYDSLASDYLKLPQGLSPVDSKDAFQIAYHIRSYARWLGRFHAFARMLQLSDEYEIPSESDSPEPDWNNKEPDREDQNGRIDYYEAYSCITQLRDGSIMTHDGYGSTVMMSNGNIQVSASRHLDLEAAGDIRMLAGGSVLVKARRNIELSAALGGLILHGYAWVRALCEKGTLWLRSNATTGKSAPAPAPKEDGAPTPEVAGWEKGVSDGYGVLVEAADGNAAYRSQRGVTIAVDGSTSDPDDTSHDIVATTRADLRLHGQRGADVHTGGEFTIAASRTFIASQKLLSDASEFLMGPDLDSPFLALRSGGLWSRRIEADQLDANQIRGKERGPTTPIPDPSPNQTLKRHFNHIGTLSNDVQDPAGAAAEEKDSMATAKSLVSQSPDVPWGTAGGGPKWAFPPREEYVWDSREKVAGAIPETLTQQFLRLDGEVGDPDQWGGGGYSDWDVSTGISGKRTDSRGGFGHYELQYKADDAGESLHAPSSTPAADLGDVPISWRPKSKFSLKVLKRRGES